MKQTHIHVTTIDTYHSQYFSLPYIRLLSQFCLSASILKTFASISIADMACALTLWCTCIYIVWTLRTINYYTIPWLDTSFTTVHVHTQFSMKSCETFVQSMYAVWMAENDTRLELSSTESTADGQVISISCNNFVHISLRFLSSPWSRLDRQHSTATLITAQ